MILGSILTGLRAFLDLLFFPVVVLLKIAKVRVLDANFYAIGHLAIEPDLWLREQALLGKKYFTILLPPHSSLRKGFPLKLEVANLFLLQRWEEHFCIIKNPWLYLLLLAPLRSPLLQIDPRPYLSAKTYPNYRKERSAAVIYNQFNQTCGSRKPFLSLSVNDLERGRKTLEQLGISKDDWFICFNCREAGHYSSDSVEWSSCRNSSPIHLELALQEVIDKGGWCIRMGSPKSAPLPQSLQRHRRVIDYPHSSVVSDFMDIFLASSCKFFLGSNSGITVTASVLGTPCVYTNIVPFGERPIFHNAIGIFKLHRLKGSGRFISFPQCLQSHLSLSISLKDYDEFNIELIENTPEEILDVVKEMFDQLENKPPNRSTENLLQTKFLSLLTSFNLGYYSHSRVGKGFLQKYQYLM